MNDPEWPTCLSSESLSWCMPSLLRARSSCSSSRACLFSLRRIRKPGRRGVRNSKWLMCRWFITVKTDRNVVMFKFLKNKKIKNPLSRAVCTEWKLTEQTDHVFQTQTLQDQRRSREQGPDSEDLRHFGVSSALDLKNVNVSLFRLTIKQSSSRLINTRGD